MIEFLYYRLLCYTENTCMVERSFCLSAVILVFSNFHFYSNVEHVEQIWGSETRTKPCCRRVHERRLGEQLVLLHVHFAYGSTELDHWYSISPGTVMRYPKNYAMVVLNTAVWNPIKFFQNILKL